MCDQDFMNKIANALPKFRDNGEFFDDTELNLGLKEDFIRTELSKASTNAAIKSFNLRRRIRAGILWARLRSGRDSFHLRNALDRTKDEEELTETTEEKIKCCVKYGLEKCNKIYGTDWVFPDDIDQTKDGEPLIKRPRIEPAKPVHEIRDILDDARTNDSDEQVDGTNDPMIESQKSDFYKSEDSRVSAADVEETDCNRHVNEHNIGAQAHQKMRVLKSVEGVPGSLNGIRDIFDNESDEQVDETNDPMVEFQKSDLTSRLGKDMNIYQPEDDRASAADGEEIDCNRHVNEHNTWEQAHQKMQVLKSGEGVPGSLNGIRDIFDNESDEQVDETNDPMVEFQKSDLTSRLGKDMNIYQPEDDRASAADGEEIDCNRHVNEHNTWEQAHQKMQVLKSGEGVPGSFNGIKDMLDNARTNDEDCKVSGNDAPGNLGVSVIVRHDNFFQTEEQLYDYFVPFGQIEDMMGVEKSLKEDSVPDQVIINFARDPNSNIYDRIGASVGIFPKHEAQTWFKTDNKYLINVSSKKWMLDSMQGQILNELDVPAEVTNYRVLVKMKPRVSRGAFYIRTTRRVLLGSVGFPHTKDRLVLSNVNQRTVTTIPGHTDVDNGNFAVKCVILSSVDCMMKMAPCI